MVTLINHILVLLMTIELIKRNISWNTFLVGGYVSLIYLIDVTRYKNLFLILMVITSIFYQCEYPKIYLNAVKIKYFLHYAFSP